MQGIDGRRAGVSWGTGLVLLLAVVLAGCGDGDARSADPAGPVPRTPAGSASPTSQGPEGSPSPTPAVPRTGLLYRDREISLSDIQAIKNGCPSDVYVEFADDGPRVLGTDESDPRQDDYGRQTEEDRPPVLAWSPPCSSSDGRFDFDDVAVAQAAADAGDLDETGCRDAARAAVGSGTAIDRYRTRALAEGERFCEDFATEGRVLLLRVVKVSGSPVAELTLSATLWAVPPEVEGPLAKPGDRSYEDQPFTVSDDVAEANDCSPGGVGIASDMPRVRYRHMLSGGGGDVEYFPSCLGSPKMRFGGYAARVKGDADPDITACQETAIRGGRDDLDVPMSELRTGDRFCMFDGFDKYVALLKVTAVTAGDPVSATFSVTRWEAPEPS
ncbi:hypothetical protein ACFYSC_31085 [Streptosporangium sp. NPDC004379]|uniref:hypothetical protein n=1 Tax=Streptosporangium sp. NPDC004379 TaxID=3366189 RepID=UPI0036AF5CFB